MTNGSPSDLPSSIVRIVYLITELNVGGAERALVRMLGSLDRSRFEASVICLFGAGKIAAEIRNAGIPVYDLGMKKSVKDCFALARLVIILWNLKPAILHSALFHANVVGRFAGSLARVPVIIAGEHTMEMESRFRSWVTWASAPLHTAVTAVSEAVRRFLIMKVGLDPKTVHVCYNGVDIPLQGLSKESARDRLHLPAKSLVVGTIGQLRPEKGQEILVKAFQILKERKVDAICVLMGDGPTRSALKELIERYELAERVYLLGEIPQADRFLPALDLFVLPSFHEGFPVALLEAMAAGLPVVATEVAGVPELVLSDRTGRLVPRGNPDALADAIQSLLQAPDLRRKLGNAGRLLVEERFTLEKATRATTELYESLLQTESIDPSHL